MKNPFIELCGCMCLTLLAPQPAAAKTAGEMPPADTLRTVFFTDIHVTPGNVQDSLFRIAVAEANASDADLVIFGGDLTNMGSDRELAHVHGLMSQLRKPWFTVPGNHETTWSESGCTTFRRLFGHAGCVATRAKGYLFLGYASGPYMKMADGMIRGEDLAWLERQAARRADRKPLPLSAQRGSDEPAGGDRDAEKRGRHGITVRPLPPAAAA